MKRLLTSSALALLASATLAQAEGITVLVEGGGNMLQSAVAEKFTEETGIEVTFVEVPYQGVFDKLSAEIASGTSNYDVATIDVVWNAAFAEQVEDLSDLFTDEVKADLPPALLADANVGGKMIGMPAQDGRREHRLPAQDARRAERRDRNQGFRSRAQS